MKRLTAIFLGLLVMSSMVVADPLYKWVDDKGNVHYSDKPQPGAKKIVLPPATTFKAPAVVQPNPVPQQDLGNGPRDAGPAAYTAIAISSPADQDTLWNTATVTVSVATTPAWQSGDDVTISVDGSSQTVKGTSATFTGLDKGQHTASASVNGLNSGVVTFYIQKTSIKKPPMH